LTFHSPREPLLVLYRQICLLQTRGQIAAATRLADEQLAHAVVALKAATAISDEELRTLFEAENERVASASVVAEMLLPALAALLQSASPANSGSTSHAPRAAAPFRPAFADSSPIPSTSPAGNRGFYR